MTISTKPTHTPLPWRRNGWVIETSARHWGLIGRTYGEEGGEDMGDAEANENAAYIVRACNALPGCIAAMEAIVAHDDDLHTSRGKLLPLALMDQIRAALTAAKGDA